MHDLRNPELRKKLLISLILSSAGSVVAAILHSAASAAIVALTSAALIFVQIFFDRRRYQVLSDLSRSIDMVLHGSGDPAFAAFQEGELSLLHHELSRFSLIFHEQKERLEEDKIRMSDALADISHQLRTPLTAMRLIVSRLSSSDLQEGERLDLYHQLILLLGRIQWLVEALLKISKIDAGTAYIKPIEQPLGKVIQMALEPLRIQAELRDIEIRTEIPPDLILSCDAEWTAEAIANIVKNALESAPPSSAIFLSAEDTALSTRLIIRDEGQGISSDDLPHIFDRYYKGANCSTSSIGLGLALCRAILAAQNATVKASNHPDGGAVFDLRFMKQII